MEKEKKTTGGGAEPRIDRSGSKALGRLSGFLVAAGFALLFLGLLAAAEAFEKDPSLALPVGGGMLAGAACMFLASGFVKGIKPIAEAAEAYKARNEAAEEEEV